MPDIFISYSSKDREHAQLLTELLTSAGFSVWIDKSGIDVATSWSASIVDAINECKAFIVMLSPSSIDSHNVIKEVSLASEKRKKILPLDLEPVILPRELEYQLAGIQRAPMTNIDAIIRALGKMGLEATGAPQAPKIVKESDGRKSLMILPFEDLSPTGDNGWFADGIASELISALSNIKALRVADPQATKEFKAYKGQLAVYAKEMSIRFFVQGDIRKFGDNIKITCRLLDIESGDFLWQESMKGTMNDVFDIQEDVANKVLRGLDVVLLASEAAKLAKRDTANAEAYELYLRAYEYFNRNRANDRQHALKLIRRSLELDPMFSRAMLRCAVILITTAQAKGSLPELVEEAKMWAAKASAALRPEDDWRVLKVESLLAELDGDNDRAVELMILNAAIDPKDPVRQRQTALTLMEHGRAAEASPYLEAAFEIDPESLVTARMMVSFTTRPENSDLMQKYAQRVNPVFEKRITMMPDDCEAILWYGHTLFYAGRESEACDFVRTIPISFFTESGDIINMGILCSLIGEYDRAFLYIQRWCEREATEGWYEILMNSVFDPLRDRLDFQSLLTRAKELPHA